MVKQTGAKLARLDASIVSDPQTAQAQASECETWNLKPCYDGRMSFPLSNQFPDDRHSGTKPADIQD